MLLVIFLVRPCCMLLHKTNIWTLQFMWLLRSVLPIITLPRPKVYSLLLCMWHCSTTANPACHEDRGERNSLFDSGPSGRLWHVAPKIHHWTHTHAGPYLIELWDCVWDFLRHLNICFCNQNMATWWYTGWSFCKKDEGRNGHNTKMIEPRHGPTKT